MWSRGGADRRPFSCHAHRDGSGLAQVYRGGRDYPWWSSTYNIALEPCASLPVLSHAAARGEALTLGAGESREIELVAVAFEGVDRITRVTPEGAIKV